VTAASRRTGVNLVTGEGLESTLAGADVVVHAALHPTQYRAVDLEGNRQIIGLLGDRPDPPHLIYVSIVGCDRNPYPYYRAKYAGELVLERSGLPVTVIRATQYHTLVARIARACAHGPISVQPQLSFQSCDHRWVAERVVDTALGVPAPGYRRTADLAGPERTTLGEAVNLIRQAVGRRPPRVIRLPAVGGTLRAFARGANLPGPDAEIGGPGFRESLRI
jgi:uncharacterized protein YbjT (DUF2867 family)